MSTRRLLLLAALPLLLAADDAAYPTRTLAMFVADWCAPCHGEVARLDEIAAAAPGWRVMVIDGDRPLQPGRLVRGVAAERRWVPTPATIARLRRELLADVPGLPYSVAFDARGKACGDTRRPLDAHSVRAVLRACGSP